MVSDVRSVALNLNSKELIFLQKVTRQEYHFITDEEQEARFRREAQIAARLEHPNIARTLRM